MTKLSPSGDPLLEAVNVGTQGRTQVGMAERGEPLPVAQFALGELRSRQVQAERRVGGSAVCERGAQGDDLAAEGKGGHQRALRLLGDEDADEARPFR